jgi:hypothetical protein
MRIKALFVSAVAISLFTMPGASLAAKFSFAGIDWSDDPATVKKKLMATGLFKKIKIYKSIFCDIKHAGAVDSINRHFLECQTRLDPKVAGNLPCLQNRIVYYGTNKTFISRISFVWSVKKKLLVYYCATLENTFRDNKDKRKPFLNELTKKYGKPVVFTENHYPIVKWSNDQELLILVNYNVLLYINKTNLKKLNMACKKRKDEIKANYWKKRGKAKKLF